MERDLENKEFVKIHLKYIKIPLTPKLLKRKEEEELRKKNNIPKKKSGKFI